MRHRTISQDLLATMADGRRQLEELVRNPPPCVLCGGIAGEHHRPHCCPDCGPFCNRFATCRPPEPAKNL